MYFLLNEKIKLSIIESLEDELQNLKSGKNESGKGKKGKKAGKTKSKKLPKKGKKDKKEKDLTSNRTMDELIEELVHPGILQKVKLFYCRRLLLNLIHLKENSIF